MALASLPGAAPGAYVRVYGNGDVAANAGDGRMLWMLHAHTFSVRAGVERPHTLPMVALGGDPVDPFTRAGENPFAVGDLTGDGVADVAVGHSVWASAEQTLAGTIVPGIVTVIDGHTGDIVWDHPYPGHPTNVAIQGGMLVVTNQTGEPDRGFGAPGSRSGMHAWAFSQSPDGVRARHAWTIAATPWARWLAVEHVGDRRLTAAWSDTPVGTGADVRGRVLLVDTRTGSTVWEAATDRYPRTLRYDASRDEVVALEQSDAVATGEVAYRLVGRSASSGAMTRSVERPDAIALSLQVGDLAGGVEAEWVVGDLVAEIRCAPLSPIETEVCVEFEPPTAGRVTVLDPAAGTQMWEQVRRTEGPASALGGVDVPQPFGLVVQRDAGRPVVVVASFMSAPEDAELQVLDGASGAVVWSRRERNLLLPLFLAPYEVGGHPALLAAPSRRNVYGGRNLQYSPNSVARAPIHADKPYQVVSAYAVADGEEFLRHPVLADVYAAAPLDVDGTGPTDIVVGGESGGVFALDGAGLSDNPTVLWSATVSGQVHHIEVADLDGDGSEDVVAAASFSVDVFDGRTGERRFTLPHPGQHVWTVSVGDVDGDGIADVVVPARDLAAYRGTDGTPLWGFDPAQADAAFFGTTVVTGDGRVVSQYQLPGWPGVQGAVVVDGATGAALWERRQLNGAANLYRGVVVGEVPAVDGPAAAFTWDVMREDATLYPRTDVYALNSGELAYSGTAAVSQANFGTVLLPNAGVQHYNSIGSTHVTPEGPRHNLEKALPNDMDAVQTVHGPLLTMANWPQTIVALDESALAGGRITPHVRASWSENLVVGATTPADLDGDGTQELLVHQFDWGGWNTSLMSQQRGGGWSMDSIQHGFGVLRATVASS